jgi:hypothetical protein
VNPTAGLKDMEKRKYLTLPRLELRPLSRPALSQSLYRLRHSGSLLLLTYLKLVKIEIKITIGVNAINKAAVRFSTVTFQIFCLAASCPVLVGVLPVRFSVVTAQCLCWNVNGN